MDKRKDEKNHRKLEMSVERSDSSNLKFSTQQEESKAKVLAPLPGGFFHEKTVEEQLQESAPALSSLWKKTAQIEDLSLDSLTFSSHLIATYEKIMEALLNQRDPLERAHISKQERFHMEEEIKQALNLAIEKGAFPNNSEGKEKIFLTIQTYQKAKDSALPCPQFLLSIPNSQMIMLYKLAAKYWQEEKQKEQARTLLLLLWNLNPSVGAFWHSYGFVIENLEKYQEAVSCYLIALSCGQDFFDPLIPLARCLAKIGRRDLSEDLLLKVIAFAEKKPALLPLKESAQKAHQAIEAIV